MKKIAILLMLVFVCAFSITACGNSAPEGKYYLDSVKITGKGMNMSINSESPMWSVYENFYIEFFSEDNTFEMYYDGDTLTGAYEMSGSKIIFDNEEMTGGYGKCTISGKTVTFTFKEDDMSMVIKFKKPANTTEE